MSLDVYLYAEPPDSNVIEQETVLYHSNITHNLGIMASNSGLYYALWRPEEIGVRFAKQLLPHLRIGLSILDSDRERLKQDEPSNGWGRHENLLIFVKAYMEYCEKYPNAYVKVSR